MTNITKYEVWYIPSSVGVPKRSNNIPRKEGGRFDTRDKVLEFAIDLRNNETDPQFSLYGAYTIIETNVILPRVFFKCDTVPYHHGGTCVYVCTAPSYRTGSFAFEVGSVSEGTAISEKLNASLGWEDLDDPTK